MLRKVVGRSLIAGNQPEQTLEFTLQQRVDLGHGHDAAEIGETGDPIRRLGDPAGHYSGVVREIAVDIERDAVQRHPAFDPDADGRDLVFVGATLLRTPYPDADAVLAPLAHDTDVSQCADDPFLQGGDEAARVRSALLEIE